MNQPKTVIGFINAGHFIDHYAMLVFAAAVIVMGPALGISYSDLLPYATPGFLAFGAGSLLTGWLGDRWSRRHMMVVFFLGIGLATASVGLAQTPWQLGVALFAIGFFASIYHPVGSAMLVSYADQLGRTVGINGVWGNLGVACSALVTGLLCKHAGAAVRISKSAMGRVLLALIVTTIATSTTFNAVTVALPKLFAERMDSLTASPTVVGLIVSGVYLFGALAQYTIGGLVDRHSLKSVFLPLSVLLAPLLWFGARLSGVPLVLVVIGIVIGIFGQATINDAMIGKYTSEEWRARAYAVRYFVGF